MFPCQTVATISHISVYARTSHDARVEEVFPSDARGVVGALRLSRRSVFSLDRLISDSILFGSILLIGLVIIGLE